MAKYGGNILDIRTSNKAGQNTSMFEAGEEVELQVFYEVTREDNWGALGFWHAKAEIYDDKGVKLADDTTTFSVAYWTQIDREPATPWTTPMKIKFKMLKRDFHGQVKLLVGG